MKVIAIDPGTTESAYCVFDGESFVCDKVENAVLLATLAKANVSTSLVIEQIRSYGMAVGAEVFDTCVWSGRFAQQYINATGCEVVWIPRRDVKLNLCGSVRAKDANVRHAIIDRFGGKEKAIGNKKKPGPLYLVSKDEWAALAVGLTYLDRKGGAK